MYKDEKDRSLCEAGRSKWFPFFSHIDTRSRHKCPFNLYFWKGNTHSTELSLLKEKTEFSRLVGKEKSPCKTILCFNNWYSFHTKKWSHFGQRQGLQNITLTTYFYKYIYQKMIYVNFCENIFQDKSIHMVFIFSNSTT